MLRGALSISQRMARGYYDEDPIYRSIRNMEEAIEIGHQWLSKCAPEDRQGWIDAIQSATEFLSSLHKFASHRESLAREACNRSKDKYEVKSSGVGSVHPYCGKLPSSK